MAEFKVKKDVIKIYDSYLISERKEMNSTLDYIKQWCIDNAVICDVFKKVSYDDMIAEWRSHNLLYDMGLFRKRTKDVDINKNNFLVRLAYRILSLFYFKGY